VALERASWPSTLASSDPGEVIVYQETILDQQAHRKVPRDSYYRRFDSVRTGRVVR
jgi:hypothetical protein